MSNTKHDEHCKSEQGSSSKHNTFFLLLLYSSSIDIPIMFRTSLRSPTINKTIQKYSRQFSSQKYAKTRAGTGTADSTDAAASMIPRGPVSWASLGLVAVAAASAVSYYQIERERRLEQAMGKIVSDVNFDGILYCNIDSSVFCILQFAIQFNTFDSFGFSF